MAQNSVSNLQSLSNTPLTMEQSDETLSLLTRLSQKPGVQSTLILSRETGAIVRTSGLLSKSSAANPSSTLPASSEPASDNYTNGRKESGMHSAEDVASLVWSFLKTAGSLVDELDSEDEVKLLRLRTKKNELIIMPGMRQSATWAFSTPLSVEQSQSSSSLPSTPHHLPKAFKRSSLRKQAERRLHLALCWLPRICVAITNAPR
jgi:dynein light chain roadblock-type